MEAYTWKVWIFGPKAITGAILIAAFWAAGAIIQSALGRIASRSDPERRNVLLLAGRTTKGVLICIGAISALGTWGVNVTSLVAGLGLVGFALGFALRDALSNLLAGALILIYRPVRSGDHITVAGLEGDVAQIDLRYTMLQAEGKKILIPNSLLFSNSIVVRTAGKEGEEAEKVGQDKT